MGAIQLVLGDSLPAGSYPAEDIVCTRDDFTEGPVVFAEASDLRGWMERRAAWWAARAGPGAEEASVAARAGPGAEEASGADQDAIRGLARALPLLPERGAVVWVGDDVREQLHLCWLAASIRREVGDVQLAVARFSLPVNGYVGLGALSLANLERTTPAPLSPADPDEASELWRRYLEPDPTAFLQHAWERRGHPFFGHLWVLARRLPREADGLTYWERRLLERLVMDEAPLARVIAHVVAGASGSTPDLIGDRTLMERLRDLERAGLVERSGDGRAIRSTSCRVTELGRRVWSGAANRVEEGGLDRWLGGCHLDSASGTMWWYEGDGRPPRLSSV